MTEDRRTFQLGPDAAGVDGLQDFRTLFGRDPDESFFQEFTDIAGTDGIGAPIRAGLPIARLKYALLRQAHYDNALALCPGASAYVYLRTRTNTGTPKYVFKIYRALMKQPQADSQPGALRAGVVFEFVNLVEQ